MKPLLGFMVLVGGAVVFAYATGGIGAVLVGVITAGIVAFSGWRSAAG